MEEVTVKNTDNKVTEVKSIDSLDKFYVAVAQNKLATYLISSRQGARIAKYFKVSRANVNIALNTLKCLENEDIAIEVTPNDLLDFIVTMG